MNMRMIFALMIFPICLAASAGQRIGAWEVSLVAEDMQVAQTVNSAGSLAGVLCFISTNACSAYISSDVACEEKAKYPLMINATTGANLSMSTCITVKNAQFLMIDNFAATVAAFESGGEVGFAIPLEGGKFRVLRFDCAGATAAIRQARANPMKPVQSKNPSSQTL
jgi:hypothetical protein